MAIFFFDKTCKVCTYYESPNGTCIVHAPTFRSATVFIMSDTLGVPLPIAMIGGGSNIKVLSVISVNRKPDASTTTVTIPSGAMYAWLMVSYVNNSTPYNGNTIVPITNTAIAFPLSYHNGTGLSSYVFQVKLSNDGTLYEHCSNITGAYVISTFIFYGE